MEPGVSRESLAYICKSNVAVLTWIAVSQSSAARLRGDSLRLRTGGVTSIRFSPNSHQAHCIEWLPWTGPTFERAQSEDKPVLLSISAPWCHWCHVMDETTYSDPDVQSVIARGFIAVRVDNDHRPDINARYNVGGWPTTAFLTPHGGLIGGATYLPPDQFLAMLLELEGAYRADKPQLYEQSRDLLQQRRIHARRAAAGPEVESSLTDRVARIVAGSYDAINGGFGSEPKFTNPSILRFVLHLARTTREDFYFAMLRKTLDAMAKSQMFDEIDGGFFRYSSAADWTAPQREKMLEDNVQLASIYLDAAIVLADNSYREISERTFGYVVDHLLKADRRGFHGSQGAHSDYFALEADQRALSTPPPLDPSCYTGSGAIAAAALLDASWKLGNPELGTIALDVLDHIDNMATSGRFGHVYADENAGTPALLGDWAGLLTGLVQAHASTAEPRFLDRAVAAAAAMVDRHFDESSGGFFDIEADENAIGHLQVREKPMPENMAAVRALLRLYQTTRNDDYRQLCEATLSAFAGVFREQGEFAAEFGLAVDIFSNPMVEITVEGNSHTSECRALVDAATRLNNPNLEIKTVQADGPALAHVCLDTLCLPPVSTAAALEESAAGIDTQPASPFRDVFQIFPGN